MSRRERAGAAALAALTLLAGCAQAPRAVSRPAPRPELREIGLPADAQVTPAFEPMARLAIAQSRRPVESAGAAGAVPGAPEDLVKDAGSAAGPAATMTLAAALEELSARPAPLEAPAAGAEGKERALHRYIAGREKLLSGDPVGALPDLKAASELDPGAGEPWRELGEAYLAQGRRPDALGAFESAVARGLEDARCLEMLGRAALERGDHRAAAGYLARAWAAHPQRQDPLLPPLITIELSRALIGMGRLSAGREALFRSFDQQPALSASTRYLTEFNAYYRRQGELMREAGDASVRLGLYAQAVDDYARAAVMPVIDGTSIAPRLVVAAERAGRPALAALFVLEGIAAKGGRAGDDDVALLGYLARLPGMAEPLGRALDAYRTSLEVGRVSPTLVRNLTRAQAAVMGNGGARTVLRSHLAKYPGDQGAIAALLSTFDLPRQVAQEAAGLVAAKPATAPQVAEACLQSRAGAGPDEAGAVGDGARLLSAWLAAAEGRAGEALRRAEPIEGRGEMALAADLARAQFALAAGRAEKAAEPLKRLAGAAGPESVRYRVLALQAQQKTRAALELAETLVEPAEAPTPADAARRVGNLLLCAELATAIVRQADAERWLLEACELDPMDDRPRARLVELYASRGDQAKVNQMVRDLRQSLPECRAMRSLRAAELARRGMWGPAEQEAGRLAEEELADPAPLRLLVSIWEQQARQDKGVLERARAWLDARLERRPQSSTLLAALTTVDLLGGEAERALERLNAALEAGAGPDVARMREKLLRESLGRSAEADRSALERLEGRARSVGESIELAQVYAQNERAREALSVTREAVDDSITISEEQAGQLAGVGMAIGVRVAQALPEAGEPGGAEQESLEAAAWFFDRVCERGFRLMPEMHEVRLVVLARLSRAGVDRLLAAVGDTRKQYPDRAAAAALRVGQVLAATGRGETALRFLPLAVRQAGEAPLEMWQMWLQVVGMAGTASDARALVDAADSAGKLRTLVDRFRLPGAAAVASYRAEGAYTAGNLMAAYGRAAAAEGAYALALELEPAHAWAANNLGYSLADRGVELDRAAALLEMAHRELPEEASITDSLGWLRYKQGRIEDEVDERGEVKVRGAVSLLQDAAMTERGRENATILDHLGDALWLAGRSMEAERYWQLAEAAAGRELRRSGMTGAADGGDSLGRSALAELRSIQESARKKLRAVSAGEPVPVAPQVGVPQPHPKAAAGSAPSSPATPGTARGPGVTPQN
jgi:tetratricopeptide (TPR) repeat protein